MTRLELLQFIALCEQAEAHLTGTDHLLPPAPCFCADGSCFTNHKKGTTK